MSNLSGNSSGSSNGRRGRVMGVPKRCWCGEQIVGKTSKSDPNPNRRYFRCGFAATNRLVNDNHTFKWVDEALLDEVATLATQMERLQEDMNELTTEIMKQQKMDFEKMQLELQKEIFERVEDVLSEFKARTQKTMMVVVLGCMIMYGLSKLVD